MRIPKKFHVKGEPWTVKYKKELMAEGEPCWGECDKKTNTIWLEKGMKKEMKERTFLHELGHAIWDGVSLNIIGIPAEVEDIIVDNMANEFHRIFFQDKK